MEAKEQEGMNMDSAPGKMPPEKTPSQLKQSLPKGEVNPWRRNLFPPAQRHEYSYEREKNAGKKLEEAQMLADHDKEIGLLPDGLQKQELKNQFALQETTANTQRMLKEDDEKKLKRWIQQNPIPAASLGISEKDPYGTGGKSPAKYLAEKHKGKSPLKAYQFMNPNAAYEFGKRMYTNPMATIGVEAGNIIGQKIQEWSERRAEQREKDREQYEREAKDMEDTFGPLIQNLDSSASVDEAEKELMTQQWKQEFAELNKLKNQNPPGISAEEYAIKKSQLLSNAKNYTNALGNLEQAAQGWKTALENGDVSDATPRDQRDILNSLATGKGMNIFSTEDGKSGTNKGLTVKNVSGMPQLTGYTEGQEAELRKQYQKLVDGGQLDSNNTSFESWAANTLPPIGSEDWSALPEGDPRRGVMIPIEKLATGDGVPRFVGKDKGFSDTIDQGVDNIIGQALSSPDAFGMNSQQKWGVVQPRVEAMAQKMLNAAPADTLRSIAADYMGIGHEEYEGWLASGGEKAIRAHLVTPMVEAMQQRFMTDPNITRHDAALLRSQQVSQKAQNTGRTSQWADEQERKQQAFQRYLDTGDIQNLHGYLNYNQTEGSEGSTWYNPFSWGDEKSNPGLYVTSIKDKSGEMASDDLLQMPEEQRRQIIANLLDIPYNGQKSAAGGSGSTGGMDDINFSNPNNR